MADVAFQVRLDEETHRRWRVKAAELGYPSLAHLVRASVEAHTTEPAGRDLAEMARGMESVRDIDPAECPKKVGHRKGVYCKHCGVTP